MKVKEETTSSKVFYVVVCLVHVSRISYNMSELNFILICLVVAFCS